MTAEHTTGVGESPPEAAVEVCLFCDKPLDAREARFISKHNMVAHPDCLVSMFPSQAREDWLFAAVRQTRVDITGVTIAGASTSVASRVDTSYATVDLSAPATVYLAVVTHQDGVSIYAGRSSEGVDRRLATGYVSDYWSDFADSDEEMPDDHRERIDRYFELAEGNESVEFLTETMGD